MKIQTRVATGPEVLRSLASRLDDLHEATDAPLTARRPWLQVWADVHPDRSVLAVLAEAGGGRLEGAALLAARRRGRLLDVTALGDGVSDYARLPVRGPEVAAPLARGVVDALDAEGRPWQLRLDRLPVGDPVSREIAASVRWSRFLPGEGAPRIVFGADRAPSAAMGRKAWKSDRNGWNRLARAGVTMAVECTGDPERIVQLLPSLGRIRDIRDREVHGASSLQDPSARRFWEGVILALAREGRAEALVVHLDGAAAAYTLSFWDGRVCRVWDGRFDPAWSQYGPGRLSDMMVLRRALARPEIGEFDWMQGMEDYKLRMSTRVEEVETLLAWSSWGVRAMLGTRPVLRAGLKRIKDRSPTLERAWRSAKRRRAARRGR